MPRKRWLPLVVLIASALSAAEWPAEMIAARERFLAAPTESAFKPVVTKIFTGADKAEKLTIDVTGLQKLWLMTDGIPDYNYCQSIWGEPELVAKDGTRTLLTELKPVSVKVGWGHLIVNQNHTKKGLNVRGKVFKHGFWSHADSALCFDLGGTYTTFETWIGIDITAGTNGHARFRVADVAGKTNLIENALAKANGAFPQLAPLARRVAANWGQEDQVKALRTLGSALAGETGELGKRSAPQFGRRDEPAALLALLAELWMAKGNVEGVAAEFAHVNVPALRRAVRDLTDTFPKEYPGGPGYLTKLNQLPADLGERLARYDESAIGPAREVAAFATRALLANPLLDFDRLLLVRRKASNLGLPANWQSNSMLRKNGYGNDVAVLSPVRPGGTITTLYRPEDDGFVGDVDLHFDGDRVLFSKSDPKGPWQVYEYGLDGKAPPRRVTPEAEPFINNYDACYLPDGDILYTSTAAMVAVPCVYGSTPVAQLFRLDRETGASRQLTFDQEHAWCPTVLNNGRILYLRWEYADLPHANSRILFHCNPDGTSQMEYYGSNSYWPNGIFYARPIPGSPSEVVGIVTGHHGVRRMGEMVLFDPARGRREATGVVQRIPGYGQPVEAVCADQLVNNSWPKFLHPFPLGREDGRGSGKYFLVSAQPSPKHKWGIYLVDTFDNMTLLAEQPGMALLEPIPWRKTTPPPVIPERIDLARKDGSVYLSDIYRGGGLAGIPRGEVKSLRLFTYTYGYRDFGGLYGSIGMDGPWDCRRILGTVPVESDGSAFFRVPANVPVAVQPLDSEGKALQLMRSWFTAMPGETISCVGCHEAQNNTPPAKLTLAARKAPTDLSDWRGKTRNFAFVREVQPVLDRNCVRCHNGTTTFRSKPVFSLLDEPMKAKWTSKMSGHVNARDGGKFSEAYRNLHRYVRHPGIESDMHMLTPMDFHADSAELVQILRSGHFGVKLSPEDWDRIVSWIDLNAPFHGEWSSIVGERAKKAEDVRAEMRKRYANVEENHEATPTPAPVPIPEPLASVPEPQAGPAVKAPDVAPHAPRREEIDLGGGARMGMVYVPKGSFVMGSNTGPADERPARLVVVRQGFWMSETEVSNAQFARFDANHNSRRESKQGYQFGVKGYPLNTPEQPAVRLSWQEARAFCHWLGEELDTTVNLPTETQWEYACRAGTHTPFSYGEPGTDFAKYANFADAKTSEFASNPYTPDTPIKNPPEFDDWLPKDAKVNDGALVSAPVGQRQPNPWGLYDMHGNVAEWTDSEYQPGLKVVRGGSWRDRPKRGTASYRVPYRPYQRVFNVGFRIVMAELPKQRRVPNGRSAFCDDREFAVADSGQRKLIRFGADGKKLWEFPDVYCYDLQRLPDEHLLFCDSDGKGSRTVEIDAKGKVVWEYRSTGEVFSCQRLADGATLIGECSNARLVEVTPDGTVRKTIPVRARKGGHGALRLARRLPGGTYIAAHYSDRCVREYDADGRVLREIPTPYAAFGVAPLPNGNILVSCERALIEYDQDSRAVWSLFEDEIPGLRFQFLTGIQPLPNGNIVVCNWLGHGKEGQGEPIFEVTRDKHIAWLFSDTKQTKWVAAAALLGPMPEQTAKR